MLAVFGAEDEIFFATLESVVPPRDAAEEIVFAVRAALARTRDNSRFRAARALRYEAPDG